MHHVSYHWSIECTAALNEYVESEVSHPVIAILLNERFGTDYNRAAVARKLARQREPKKSPSTAWWPREIKARLVELYNAEHPISFTDMVDVLKKEFGCDYTRSAIIGCSKRLGLKGKKPTSSANHRPRLRIVAANSNSTRKRVIQVTDTELPALRCVEVIPRNLSLLELEKGDCRYPYGGEVEGDAITFCGHPKIDDSSYCRAHFALTRRPVVNKINNHDRYLPRAAVRA